MKRYLLAVMLMPVALATGCGEDDLIDDSQPSDAQVRSLIKQFQSAAADDDDEAACELMNERMRENVEESPVRVDGEIKLLPCGLDAGLQDAERELPTLPGAKIVYVAIDRHDQTADVQLANGTRFLLRRLGENADGEWRISSLGYRPSPEDWKGELRLVQPVTQQDLIACLRRSGLETSLDKTFSGTTKDGLTFAATTIQIGSLTDPKATAATVATVLILKPEEAAQIHGTTDPAGIRLRQPFGERVAANAWVRSRLDPSAPVDFVRPAPPAPEQMRDKVVDCAG